LRWCDADQDGAMVVDLHLDSGLVVASPPPLSTQVADGPGGVSSDAPTSAGGERNLVPAAARFGSSLASSYSAGGATAGLASQSVPNGWFLLNLILELVCVVLLTARRWLQDGLLRASSSLSSFSTAISLSSGRVPAKPPRVGPQSRHSQARSSPSSSTAASSSSAGEFLAKPPLARPTRGELADHRRAWEELPKRADIRWYAVWSLAGSGAWAGVHVGRGRAVFYGLCRFSAFSQARFRRADSCAEAVELYELERSRHGGPSPPPLFWW
jgi:hypothetical protein